jgi:hypothetical protein
MYSVSVCTYRYIDVSNVQLERYIGETAVGQKYRYDVVCKESGEKKI